MSSAVNLMPPDCKLIPVSQPVPILIAVSVAAVPVRLPMLRALMVTWASPVTAPVLMKLTVLVPAVALPIVGAILIP